MATKADHYGSLSGVPQEMRLPKDGKESREPEEPEEPGAKP